MTLILTRGGAALPEQQIPPTIHSSIIQPAIFLLQEDGGDAALAPKAIQLAVSDYYKSLIDHLKSQLHNGEVAIPLAKLESRLKANLVPVWLENIIVVCRSSELVVALYPRNAGWSVGDGQRLTHANILAYTCTIDSQTWKVRKDTIQAVNFRNFYPNLLAEGLASEYPKELGFEAPLNSSAESLKAKPE